MKVFVVLFAVLLGCLAQRSPYAGRNPIGYPKFEAENTAANELGNRFGDDDGTTTTIRLPIEALGDADLVKRLSKLPRDQQPFWLLNWQALEENRKNPQTYPQKGNSFIDTNPNAQFQR